MTVDSHNTEAVSSRTKPNAPQPPRSFAESVYSCPKCGDAMEPLLLGMNDNGTQKVWWTCSGVKTKKCTFPLDMPQEIFWVSRSAQDIERNEVPPPNIPNLPVRYQHLYPSLFQSSSRKRPHDSRQGSHESTRSISSMESAGSSNSTSVSAWDVDDTTHKSRTAFKLDAMRKPKVVITQKKTFIPNLNGGNRSLAFAESFNTVDKASTTITTRLKLGRGDKKMTAESREMAKKNVIKLLSGVHASEFKKISPSHVMEMKKAVIEHVKRRRAEREQLAELERMNEKRHKVVDINELVKAKLAKNKMEYKQRRIEMAREARLQALRVSRTAGAASASAYSGYDEEEEGEEGHPSYAATPPYLGSPGPSTSFDQEDGQFHNDFDFLGMDSSSSSGMDHSGEVHSMGGGEEEGSSAGSPFTELGPLQEEDLAGIEINPDFEHAFAEAFGDDFADEFADIADFN